MTLKGRRAAEIERLELEGRLDPACPACREEFYPFYRNRWRLPGGHTVCATTQSIRVMPEWQICALHVRHVLLRGTS